MKNKTLEIFISLVGFSLLNILYYLLNFSKWGAIPLVLTLVYYFVRVNNKKEYIETAAEETAKAENEAEETAEAEAETVETEKAETKAVVKKEEHTLSEWIGVYFGAFFVDMFFIKACYEGIIPSVPTISLSGDLIYVFIILIIEIIVLLKLNKPSPGKHGVRVFFKYIILLGVTLGCSYNFIDWLESSIVFALIPVLFVSLAIEMFVSNFDVPQKHAIFSWTMVLCILFNLSNWLYPDFSISMVSWICNISLSLQYRWYVALILILLSVFGIVSSITLRQKDKAKASDTKLCILSLFVTIFFWVITSNVTKYNIIFILIYAVVNCICLASGKNDRNVDIFGVSLSRSNIYCSIVLALTSGLPISFYQGTVLQYAVFACIVLFITFQYGNYKSKSEKTEGQEGEDGKQDMPHKKWFFWQVIITLVALYGAVIATVTNRFIGGYILIASLYLLATLANIIISFQNPLRPKNHSVIRVLIAIPVIAVFLFCSNRSAISVEYSVDNNISSSEGLSKEAVQESGNILLGIDIRNDDVTIEKAYYYWLQDDTDLTPLRFGENQENVIEPKNDCLCIVCETENGVVFTDRHWFFNRELESYVEVAQ